MGEQAGKLSLQGVLKARQVVYRHLRPTPLREYPLLSQWLGCQAYVKHENHHPTGSFKIRGGLNLMSRLRPEERAAGVITATRGNHGQSIALAARLYGVKAHIVVPHHNNPEKNEAMRAFGANLLIHGRDFDEAREKVELLQRQQGLRYIHSANEPDLIHGVGTYALEILEELPDVEYIFVPVGGGSGLCGVLTVIKTMAPQVKVIGVQAEKAPAVYLSWKAGKPIQTDSADTMADGLATRVPFELTFELICRQVDELMLVTEEEIEEAIYQLYRTTHNVAEGAGAAATAAARRKAAEIAGKKVVLILSGCNLESGQLRRILETYHDSESLPLSVPGG